MQGWCKEHHPHLASWPTKQQFSNLEGLIRHALRNSGIADTWDTQNSLLDSDPGRDYIKRLYEQRGILREQMRPFKWEILKSVQRQRDCEAGK